MSARRRIVAVWAGLCLGGIAATSALDADPYAGGPEFPGDDPTPAESHAVDCEEIAGELARERAEAAAERQRVLTAAPSAFPSPPVATFRAVAVPEGCADELRARGLTSP
ncbi:hypothetical protein GCM10010377_23120 [Streptomyces viridiviolaceus]|uniref:Uncharacterized protein n=1 Tax=Streptomyces viridiviolaceus TaxID=68282 RepID=A0ABW2DUZ5_9ACTN|nr:hypothetical protein [Streptomyces viridiviolaceus]GHB32205.1 hypothetical protein GCM10010377_23120 [Streptomyces viridiviolaceus]